MSDEGDKVCPLCAELMDLTDQQLKPCKCGYEICVWCWHHIMELAEKEETEGRCPACRTPYDKERIVGMAASCERFAAENKQKNQKGKARASTEPRKHLSTVRVIQRNLVYIIGLPVNLCDENLLERKEYFGQYGKILKVSISRTTSSTNQQSSNTSVFSVYITYGREEEAVRCIQAVHNYILAGKPLRACFGTTKYCHAWLRNVNCSNPDCLYLHELGSQEDSFTKDEIISTYTRSRLPHIPSCNLQRRAGNVLPPSEDWFNSGSTSASHSVKSVSNVSTGQLKVANGCFRKPAILPAAAYWGVSTSNTRLVSSSILYSQTSTKQTAEETDANTSTHSSIYLGKTQVSERSPTFESNGISELSTIGVDSAWDDDPISTSEVVESSYPAFVSKSRTSLPSRCSAANRECETSGLLLSSKSASCKTSSIPIGMCATRSASIVSHDKDCSFSSSAKKINEVNGIAPKSLSKQCVASSSDQIASNDTDNAQHVQAVCLGSSPAYVDINHEGRTTSILDLSTTSEAPVSLYAHESIESSSLVLEPQKLIVKSTGNGGEGASVDFVDSIHGASINTSTRSCSSCLANSLDYASHKPRSIADDHVTGVLSSESKESSMHFKAESNLAVFGQTENAPHNEQELKLKNMCKPASTSDSALTNSGEGFGCVDGFNELNSVDEDASVHNGESSIITNILSLDFDPWDDSVSLANNFSKLLGKDEEQDGSFKLSELLSTKHTNQSRFSFARQENQSELVESSIGGIEHVQKYPSLEESHANDFQQVFMLNGLMDGNSIASCSARVSLHSPAGISRIKVSAPPGFSAPDRSPPPGFLLRDCYDKKLNTTYSENHLLGNSSLGNQYHAYLTETSAELELIDPAILAVGKGQVPLETTIPSIVSGSAFPSHFSSDSDRMHQLSLHQSFSSHKSKRISDPISASFLPLTDSYLTSHLLPQNNNGLSPLARLSLPQSRSTPLSSNHWDGWNDGLGLNNHYLGNGEHKYHIPSAGNVYGRAVGL